MLNQLYITNVEIGGLDKKDHPDYSDAFIVSADYLGKPMTEEQLEEINKDTDFVYRVALNG